MNPSPERIVDAVKKYEARRAFNIMRAGRIFILVATMIALVILLSLMRLLLDSPKGGTLVTTALLIGVFLGVLFTAVRRIVPGKYGRRPVVSAWIDVVIETLLYSIVFCCLVFLVLVPFIK
jgi:hypothetical protein